MINSKSPLRCSSPLAATAFAVVLFATAACSPALASEPSDLTELSLEALMDIEVTSASKKPQKLAKVAAAAFVISQEDIRRSGATNIPDLLRMVPGLQVARIDANKWAVSIRGFSGRFANKLLVLIDGRSVYTPLFTGVYWEQQNTPLEDIERIEVIRGPGAALWGANAVNGVINIITRKAEDTTGGLISAGGGSTEKGFGTLRYGFNLGETSDLRVYGNYANRGPGKQPDGADAADAWQSGATGFRLDSQLTDKDAVTVQGDFYSGSYDENYTLYKLPTPTDPRYSWSQNAAAKANGTNLLTRWQRTLSDSDSIALQLYYDHYRRTMTQLNESRDTVDLDLQHRFSLLKHQDIIWGLGYRYTHDKLDNSPYILFQDTAKGTSLFSGFVHDEISLIPGTLSLILGSRFEHNDYSGFEIQPNGRLLWTPSVYHTFWASISRAVRTPSRGDQSIQYRFHALSPAETGAPLPIRLEIDGNSDFKSESVLAYELGYRTNPLRNLSFDLSLFLNQYDKLRIPNEAGAMAPELVNGIPTNLAQHYALSNNMHGHTYGLELSATWTPLDWWRLQANYSYLCSIMYRHNNSTGDLAEINRMDAAHSSPRHQGSLRSGLDLGKQIELDIWLRAVDEVAYIDKVRIPGYLTMDLRLAWKPTKLLEFSVVGQNLLRNQHPEFIPEFINTTASEAPRSVYGKVTWKF